MLPIAINFENLQIVFYLFTIFPIHKIQNLATIYGLCILPLPSPPVSTGFQKVDVKLSLEIDVKYCVP